MDAPTTVAVSTSAIAIATGGACVLQALDSDFYVGGESVTTSNGLQVAQGAIFSMDLRPGETLYAITDSSATVRVMRSA